MSHFGVLIFTKTKPTEDELTRILQPYHEYECTGTNDEYVVDVDVTDKVREEFAKPRAVVVLADGRAFSRYDTRFYTKEPEIEFMQKEFELPDGAQEREMPADEARKLGIGFRTMRDCAADFGAKEKNGRFYDRTNPNARWDWWQIGGRWTGHLTPQYNPEKDPQNREFCTLCLGSGKRQDMKVEGGCNGCGGKGTKVAWPTQWKRHAGDQMQVADIPIDEIRANAAQHAAARWDTFQRILAGRTYPDWDEICERHGKTDSQPANITAARAEYRGNPVIVEFSKHQEFAWMETSEERALCGPRAAYITEHEHGALATSAFIDLDGKWNERGTMGSFAHVPNKKEEVVWSAMFANAFKSLPPTAWVTVVDCHI